LIYYTAVATQQLFSLDDESEEEELSPEEAQMVIALIVISFCLIHN
jgi:hypothetical protein